MKFPAANHKSHTQPVPEAVESNAKQLERLAEQVSWKKIGRLYWGVALSVIATVMIAIIAVGVANKLVSLL